MTSLHSLLHLQVRQLPKSVEERLPKANAVAASSPGRGRHRWSEEQENYFLQCVKECGRGHWSAVSQLIRNERKIPSLTRLDPVGTQATAAAEVHVF